MGVRMENMFYSMIEAKSSGLGRVMMTRSVDVRFNMS